MKSRGALIILLLAGVLYSPAADAVPPDFRRTQVYFQPSVRMNHFMGHLQNVTGWSLGMGVTQGVQFGWFGINLTIDTDFFLTAQSPPPFNHGLQTAGARFATRFLAPVWDLRLFSEAAVQRFSIISNALVEEIGPQLYFHTTGGALGARYVGLSPFYVEVKTTADYAVDLDESWLLGIEISFGLHSLL